jgi:hypothetical protein
MNLGQLGELQSIFRIRDEIRRMYGNRVNLPPNFNTMNLGQLGDLHATFRLRRTIREMDRGGVALPPNFNTMNLGQLRDLQTTLQLEGLPQRIVSNKHNGSKLQYK